ncbi:hypothetical protein ACAG39_12325 [Caldicellulosiruptoraceae bacterium PP1]
MKKTLLYSLHIFKNHVLTFFIFFVFMYMYFGLFKRPTALLITGIIISFLYCYGFWSSGRFYAKSKKNLTLQEGIIATLIAVIPSVIIFILAYNALSFDNKWRINTSWQNVLFRVWNSPFIGIYSWAESKASIMHNIQILKNAYLVSVFFLPVSNILGFVVGILEKRNIIKLPEFTYSQRKNVRNKNNPNKTGRTY